MVVNTRSRIRTPSRPYGPGIRWSEINITRNSITGPAKPNPPSVHDLAVIGVHRPSCRVVRLSSGHLYMVVAALTNCAFDVLETFLCEKWVVANQSPNDAPVIALVKAVT